MRVSQKERDHRIDVALAEGRYRITSRYSANGLDVTNLMFCNLVKGRCEVCGARPPTRVVHGDPERLPGEDEATYWKRFSRLNQERIEELEREGPEIEGCFSMTVHDLDESIRRAKVRLDAEERT